MPLSFGLLNMVLDTHLRTSHVAVHSGDPGVDGTENLIDVPRSPVIFGPANRGMVFSTTPAVFQNMPEGAVTHITIWDAPDGGRLLADERLSARVPVPPRGTFVIEKGKLTIGIA